MTSVIVISDSFERTIRKGVYRGEARGAVPPLRHVNGGGRKTQSYHTFKIINCKMKNIKKISLLF